MHFAFIDIAAAYTLETPRHSPLGGTQAAVCHLGAALLAAGHRLTLVTQQRGDFSASPSPGFCQLPPERLDAPGALDGIDLLVLNGRWTEKLAAGLKKRAAAPLVGWMHEAVLTDSYTPPAAAFSGLVFVSEWQKRQNQSRLPPGAGAAIIPTVIPNGIAPGFHALPPVPEKTEPPLAVYVGSSKRGLLDLPAILPALHARLPALRFEIYSDGVVSRNEADNAAFRAQLAALPQVDWVGGVSQEELPRRLSRAWFFLSPNTYPETFCIALAESMAAGLYGVITPRGALPETAHGFAAVTPAIAGPDDGGWSPGRLDPVAYADFAAAAITGFLARPEKAQRAHLAAQSDFARQHYSWPRHAQRWIALARELSRT